MPRGEVPSGQPHENSPARKSPMRRFAHSPAGHGLILTGVVSLATVGILSQESRSHKTPGRADTYANSAMAFQPGQVQLDANTTPAKTATPDQATSPITTTAKADRSEPAGVPPTSPLTRTVKEKNGNSFWSWAKERLGRHKKKPVSIPANNMGMNLYVGENPQVKDPNVLHKGQKLTLFTSRVMKGLNTVRNADLKDAPKPIKKLQKLLRSLNHYDADDTVNSTEVRRHDERVVKYAETVAQQALQPGKVQDFLSQENITLAEEQGQPTDINTVAVQRRVPAASVETQGIQTTAAVSQEASAATLTPANKVDGLPPHISKSQLMDVLNAAASGRLVNLHGTLDHYSSVWDKLAARKHLLGRDLTIPETNLLKNATEGINYYGYDFTDMGNKTHFRELNKKVVLLGAALSHLTPDQVEKFKGTPFYDSLEAIVKLNYLSDSQSYHDQIAFKRAGGVALLQAAQVLDSNKIFDDYEGQIRMLLKDPNTASDKIAHFLNTQEVKAALANIPQTKAFTGNIPVYPSTIAA